MGFSKKRKHCQALATRKKAASKATPLTPESRDATCSHSNLDDAVVPSAVQGGLPSTSDEVLPVPSTSSSEVFVSVGSTKKINKAKLRKEGLKKVDEEVICDESKHRTVVISESRLSELSESKCECSVDRHLSLENDGFEDTIKMTCSQCQHEFISNPEVIADDSDFFERNASLVYHSIIDGYGIAGLKRLLGILGMPTMGFYKYYRYVAFLAKRMNDFFVERREGIHESVKNFYKENTTTVPDENGNLNIDISYDGTWQKRGHTSLIGMGFIIETNTCHVIDYEILSKYCKRCEIQEGKLKKKIISREEFAAFMETHNCGKNFDGSSGAMEKEGAIRLFNRSTEYGLQYENFIGDGDSKAYDAVIAENNGRGPYANVKVKKLYCVNHFQKRFGSKMRKLLENERVEVETKAGKKVKRSLLGGKSKLTGNSIDTLTEYFGNALRNNVGNSYEQMRRAIMATYFHVFEDVHYACPLSEDSFCDYQRQVAQGKDKKDIKHKKSHLSINIDDDGKKK